MRKMYVLFAVVLITSALGAMGTSVDSQGDKVINAFTPVGSSVTTVSNVAVFQDYDPWGYTSITDILNAHSISYTIYGSSDIGNVNLTPFDKVIIASQQTYNFYANLSTHSSWLEDYVINGGCLELHFATWSDYDPSGLVFAFGITVMHTPTAPTYDDVDRAMPGHDVFNVPNPVDDDELDNWGYSSHGYFNSLPAGSDTLAINIPDGTPCLIEYQDGGSLLATIQPVEWAWANGYSDILENMILYCSGPTDVGENIERGQISSLNVFPSVVKDQAEISFTIESKGYVSLKVYDASGKLVETLKEGTFEPGTHTITWKPNYKSGVYFVNVTGPATELNTKVLISR